MSDHPSELSGKLQHLINASANMVVLTGAGISTESGIPDFRSPGGVWSQFRIIQYDEFMSSEAARLEDWRRRFYMEDQLGEVKPNIGHQRIAEWVMDGRCSALITQNIDGLHQQAGTPDEAIIEIHGNARSARCTSCGTSYDIAECRSQLEREGKSPACTGCGGIIKSNVVMFGEAMPVGAMRAAFEAAQNCDLFLVVGTSLAVFPAADLPMQAKGSGASLVIINREPTSLDGQADLVIHAGIGETFQKIP